LVVGCIINPADHLWFVGRMLDAHAVYNHVIAVIEKELNCLSCIRMVQVSYLGRQNQLLQIS